MKNLAYAFGVFALGLSLTTGSAMAQTTKPKRKPGHSAKSVQEQYDEQLKRETTEQKKKAAKVEADPFKNASVRKIEAEIAKVEAEQEVLQARIDTYRAYPEHFIEYKDNAKKLSSLENKMPQGKALSGLSVDIGQDSFKFKDGKGKIDLSINGGSSGMLPLIRPSDTIDFSMPLLYNANAGIAYEINPIDPNTSKQPGPSSAAPFNLGAAADGKLAAELAIGIGKRSHVVVGPAAGFSTDFGVVRQETETAKKDLLGRPYTEVNAISKGNGYAAVEGGLSFGITDPTATVRAFYGKGNIFAKTPELELGENNLKTYDSYGAQFMIKNRVQGDISAKVFNGDGNAIYKGSVYARVSETLWLGASARVIDVTNAATRVNQSATSIRAGIQWTLKTGNAE